jgi:hypothetical protein
MRNGAKPGGEVAAARHEDNWHVGARFLPGDVGKEAAHLGAARKGRVDHDGRRRRLERVGFDLLRAGEQTRRPALRLRVSDEFRVELALVEDVDRPLAVDANVGSARRGIADEVEHVAHLRDLASARGLAGLDQGLRQLFEGARGLGKLAAAEGAGRARDLVRDGADVFERSRRALRRARVEQRQRRRLELAELRRHGGDVGRL